MIEPSIPVTKNPPEPRDVKLLKQQMDQKVKNSVEQWAKDNGVAKPNEVVDANIEFTVHPINDPIVDQKAEELLERLKS